jgi:hypothetical protein
VAPARAATATAIASAFRLSLEIVMPVLRGSYRAGR